MHWVAASLVAALFLGIYELCTKHAVHRNAVLPVLFLANVISAAIWVSLIFIQRALPELVLTIFTVTPLTLLQHAQIALKSCIVACSWVATYFAVKHLPITISSPIRATAPVWTLLGALLILGERPTCLELLGITVTIAAFAGLSFAGRREGIRFYRNKWIGWSALGMFLGAVSTLYDKHLLGRVGFGAATVQAWFSIYLAVIFLPLALAWKLRLWTRHEFHWRSSIVFLSLALLVSDFLYFNALGNPDALISIVASLRRGNTVVAFFGGILLFGEAHSRVKILAVLGVIAGIVITLLG